MAVLGTRSLVGTTSASAVGAIGLSAVGATRLRSSVRWIFAVGATRLRSLVRRIFAGGATRPRSSVRRGFTVGATDALAAAAVMLAAPAHGAAVDPDFHIVVRTYDASAAVKDLAAMFADAAAILEDAGVGVIWIRCDVAFVQRDNPCLRPLAANELAIRFVRLPPHLVEQPLATLGDSLVDTRLGAGALATIYVNRVTTLARRCDVEVRTLLARATAHEIGHLLLGTTAHASTGLMRASWSQANIRRTAADDWTFTSRDARAIREKVRARNARRLAAAKLGE